MKMLPLLLLTCCLCIGVACSSAQKPQPNAPREFRLPDVPTSLTTPEARAEYLSLHYWDHFDFADTSLITRPEISEQAFVNFINILPFTPKAQEAVDTLVHRATVRKEMLNYFIELGNKYLYEPNSPMHNEELHILMLRALVNNPRITEKEKNRPHFLLEMALKNRPGDVAADFTFTGRDGKRQQLADLKADYVILYFNDPECEDCHRMKDMLSQSTVINHLLKSGRLKLLSVCVEGKTKGWQTATFPPQWIDGYDDGQILTRDQVYDLKAMPTLYLLDAKRRVILKDASIQEIEVQLS
jgi:hypothetical protein